MGKPKDRRGTPTARYTPTAQVLHWLIALLILVQFVLARMAAPLPLGAHKLALFWRSTKSFWDDRVDAGAHPIGVETQESAAVAGPPRCNRVERFLARFTHVSFYILLIAMPLERLADVVSQELLGQLVRRLHLAKT